MPLENSTNPRTTTSPHRTAWHLFSANETLIMPTVYITRKAHFNAAHRLHNPDKSDAWNRETFGPCNNANWHGHNYTLEVTVAGEPDPETGYVMDLGKLKQVIETRIIQQCDHKNLNMDVDFLQGIMPSTEHLVIAFWHQLAPVIEGGRLHCIRLYETERNSAEYYGE